MSPCSISLLTRLTVCAGKLANFGWTVNRRRYIYLYSIWEFPYLSDSYEPIDIEMSGVQSDKLPVHSGITISTVC